MRPALMLGAGVLFAVLLTGLVGGLLALWWPYLELINQFRPFWLAGAVVMLAAASILRQRSLLRLSLGVFVFNAALCIVPLFWCATSSEARPYDDWVSTEALALTIRR